MNDDNLKWAEEVIGSSSYIQQARQARSRSESLLKVLLTQRRLPESPWPDSMITMVLAEIAGMDSNNFDGNIGLGERESRIYSSLVSSRHYHFGHGIGRSGDIAEIQPKAAGSSLVMKLTNAMVLDAIRISGATKQAAAACQILPLATGMTLALVLRTVANSRPGAKYVLWPRIDQRSCLKSIVTAGLIPIVIENILDNDQVTTDLDAVAAVIDKYGPESIVAVMTTTSCFAPRVPDRIVDVAVLCKDRAIPHVVNNAYGLQSSKFMHALSEGCRIGRVDVFVQSTDKNFMVPVGGAIVAGPHKSLISDIGKMYPGRASMSPVMDLFITLLSMGSSGYKDLLAERKIMYNTLRHKLQVFAERHQTWLLDTPRNDISLALSLQPMDLDERKQSPSMLGSMLFSRLVSGTRVVAKGAKKTVCGIDFDGYGAHIDNYPVSYLNVAAAIGMREPEIDMFFERLEKVFKELKIGSYRVVSG
ncbi:soluble liver antigen/liver pancreas antigen [Polychytrium aggregatum]|uniref:soluble liver antigen/liver pancreas antigen n=1 Tax=Polychytrium aggregatum TaxID=110093 RepID=UPI0022FE3C6C|nr:soluble liver antigen/liver pancreas antigen [Polychytrium aggregatum]KAI9209895.1 soluble liver antigen/liver pancreas antigen [Polychytrium aggregatum]